MLAEGLMADEHLAHAGQGIMAGTRIASAIGWRPVEALAEGDMVLTFDHGMQAVRAVRRRVVWAADSTPDLWPLDVPPGALGNRNPMVLMPGQSVVIESDLAEDSFGDPFVLIPAEVLEGYRGIARLRPADRIEVVTLTFDRDEVVFANSGAMFLCGQGADLIEDMIAERHPGYTVLPLDVADHFVACLEAEEAPVIPQVGTAA